MLQIGVRTMLITLFLLSAYTMHAQVIGVISEEEASKPTLSLVKKGKYYQLIKIEDSSVYLDHLDSVIQKEIWASKCYFVQQNHKWGLITVHANVCIPLEFDKIEQAFNTFYYVEKNNKRGVYDYAKLIVPCEEDEVKSSYSVGAEFLFRKGNYWGIYNGAGNLVAPAIYEKISKENGTIVLQKDNKNSYFIDNKIVTIDGIDLNRSFDRKSNYPGSAGHYYTVRQNNLWAIVDKNFNYVIKPVYQRIDYIKPLDVFFLKQNNKWGIADFENKTIIAPFAYDSLYSFSNIIIVKKDNTWRFFDLTSRKIIEDIAFDKLEYFNNQYYRLTKGRQKALVDKGYKLIIPFTYENIFATDNKALFEVVVAGKSGLINDRGKVIIPAEYEHLTVKKNIILYMEDIRCGILSTDNKVLLPALYTNINPEDGYIEVRDNLSNKWFKLNYQFECIENCKDFKK